VAGIERTAEAEWQGGLANGSGTVAGRSSGAIAALPVTWASRVESPEGRTSPEELVAAAHAACYAMAFSHVLGEAGTPPERLHVTATVRAELGDEGLAIVRSDLEVRGRVPGADAAEFERQAGEAERGCPVSNALRGSIEIGVRATLED
jgi:osmotically inducible protein OsmC